MRRDIQSWRQLVQRDERLTLVRVIKLTGYTISQEKEDEESYGGGIPKELRQNARWIGHPILMENDGDEGEEPRLLTGMDHKGPLEGLPMALPVQWSDEKPWQPLIEFCKELPGLEDMVFASASPFPRCLLSHLHSDHPECRLHIHNFCLRSLIHSNNFHPELHTQPIHPDDIALATSPCLYSIVSATAQYRGHLTVDYNEEAIMEMANGLAPRLKNVYLLPIIVQGAPELMRVPRPPFQGFPRSECGGLPGGRPRGRLHNLTLYDYGIAVGRLTQWTACTDFKQLRSLALKCSVGLSAIKHLTQMALQKSFTALSSLEINVGVFSTLGEREADADPRAAELLAALRPLQELYVRGAVRDKSFYAITIHHADALQKLCFDGKPSVTISMAAAGKLTQRCLQLVELELYIARTPGDERETAIYRAIGALPHLRRLTLHLFCNIKLAFQCSDARNLTDPTKASSIQGVYRQAAIDSALARTMFGLLSAGSQLRLLELRPCGFSKSTTLGWWLRWLGREWSIHRDAGNITLRERGVMIRQRALSQIQRQASSSGHAKIHKEVWDATWPPSSEKWWDDWTSVPLKMAEKRKFESQ
ncbi:hypothetical protein PWT90_01813 [Aphanocladium album]|nr:hypothetical protein PWT90_01813 [Aphanocladium album]